ncbi:TetR/AcrR family transcriptional regulator [Actinomadura atramentaria]|uniref:TetR/AcrR family transcriptional regulator n=1 Tax=Actinomadura atramentaria TaxID=1990 RepID=UPI0003649420|nr:TetR/AcrR family transcriptional regulator [Actinomadura atramentaria]
MIDSAARRRSLTPDRIVDAAMKIIEDGGPQALTFRRLGAELGADHTAVLRHFGSKDDLLLALAERLLAAALDGFAPSVDWRETLAGLARRVRRACCAHPQVAVLVAGRTTRRETEFLGAEIVLAALHQAGLAGREAASCYRALVDVALAQAAFEANLLVADPKALAGDAAAWGREYLAASPEKYPHLAAVAPHLAEVDREDQFETALALFLDAVELRAARA